MYMSDIASVFCDVVVAGGGLSGVCTAVAAAREGARVALVQNRPVLGGNSSSEIRVWTTGAVGESTTSSVRYGMETGVIGELQMENLRKNHDGNPYLWDAIVLDTVKREQNIALYLNTEIHSVAIDGARILSASGRQAGTEREFCFEAGIFVDCTGDGVLGALAGADWTMGRESRETYGEVHAETVADDLTLGSTMFYYTKDSGHPVAYYAPDFAYDLAYIEAFLRKTGKTLSPTLSGCELWWFEYGGLRDTIGENEIIRDELQRMIYGVWNYIKNSGHYDADTLTLEWIGVIPGKRESRRFIGPHVLCEGDIVTLRHFEDGVCFGGSPIDPHPPEGIYSLEPSNRNFLLEGIFEIPLRCLYSRNVANLYFAGRVISASHVAFCSTRVMKTCAVIGQAAGTAAAMSARKGLAPSEFGKEELSELRQRLLREDCFIPGLRNADEEDMARTATVEASGWQGVSQDAKASEQALDEPVWFFLPPPERSGSLTLYVTAAHPTVLRTALCATGSPWNYRDLQEIEAREITLEAGERALLFELDVRVIGEGNVCVWLDATADTFVHTAPSRRTGFFAAYGEILGHKLRNLRFATDAYPDAYAHTHVIDGLSRPWGSPSLWVSPLLSASPWIRLTLEKPAHVRLVIIFCNPDLLRALINIQLPDLQEMGYDEMPPELLRDFDLFARNTQGRETCITSVRGNYQRRVVCEIDEPDIVSLRISPLASWGAEHAEIFEIRIYGEGIRT